MAVQTVVKVTQEDIDAAVRNNSSRCVGATAIAKTIPDATRIIVDVHSIKYSTKQGRYTYLCPPAVAEYVVAFDAGDTLHPFTFRLRTDQRMVVKRRGKTEKGKEVQAAKSLVRKAKAKVEKVEADSNLKPGEEDSNPRETRRSGSIVRAA